MNIMKRYLSIILLICMVLTMFPAAAYAEDSIGDKTAEPVETEYEEPAITSDATDETAQAYIVRSDTTIYYSTIYDAYTDAEDNETIVLCDDVNLTTYLYLTKSVTITDDGSPRNIYCCNTTTADSSKGRGIQINAGKNLTISATAMGNLTIQGQNTDGIQNAKEAIFIYNGTLNLSNLIVKDCCNTAVYSSKACITSNKVTAVNCRFENNGKSSYDAADICNCNVELTDVHADDISVPAACSCTLGGTVNATISLASGFSPISIAEDFSDESAVTLSVSEINEGDTILTGSVNSDNCKCFSLSYSTSSAQFVINESGAAETLKVASYVNSEGETVKAETLSAAVENAFAGTTVTVINDCSVDSRIKICKDLTITDDGNSHGIYVYNTDESTDGGYGRGFQVGDGAKVSISATELGNLTIYGHSQDGGTNNAREAVCIFFGELTLNNLIIRECKNSAVYSRDEHISSNSISVINSVFEYNEKDTYAAADISNCSVTLINVTADDISVPAGYSCTLNGRIVSKISLISEYKPIVVGSGFSTESEVTVSVEEASAGYAVLTGELSGGNCECFVLVYSASSGNQTLRINESGEIESVNVASYTNSSGVTVTTDSLSNAVANAKAGSVITIIEDCNISSRITVEKNLTITDDGTHHTLYLYNTDTTSTGGYGRAIQLQSSKTLTVTGTSQGGLTLTGHNRDSSSYNRSSIFYVYTGTLILNDNVEITDCQLTYGSGVICVGLVNDSNNKTATAKLNGCYIRDNTSTSKNGGTAVYVYQGSALYLNDGTTIKNNSATSSVSGAVYNEVSDSATAVTHLQGNVTVSGNLKSCTKQENEGVAHDGKPSNIQLSSENSLAVDGNISGSIGIDYSGNSSGIFGKASNTQLSIGNCLTEDGGNYSTVTYDKSGNLYWHLIYSIAGGDITDKSQYSYKLGNADITMTSISDNADVISITADCGSFSIAALPENCGAFEGVKYDGTYTNSFSAADKYRGVSVYAELDETEAETFIKSVTFTAPGDGMEQTMCIGLHAGGSEAKYFGGSVYSYCSDTAVFERAKANSENSGKYLATVTSSAENAYLMDTFGNKNGWLGASVQSGMWYWIGGPEEGTVFGGSASSSEGYNGAYTNWAEGEPDGSGCCAYLDGTGGKWISSDGSAELGYYMESADSCAAEIKTVITVSGGVTKLNAVSPSFDGDIGMYYYFSFSDTLKESENAYVSVKVGDGEAEEFKISDIATDDNKGEYGYYVIKVQMAAKQMNDNVEIKIFDGSGNNVSSYGGAGRKNYNLRYYAEKVIKLQSNGGSDKYNENFSSDIVQMVKAMLNYGAAAQMQFGYNTENPANSGFEDEISTAPNKIDDSDDAAYINGDSETFTGASLVADSSTVLRVYLGSDYAAKVDGAQAELKSVSGEYCVDIPVNAQNLSHIYSIDANGKNLQINAYYVINGLLSSDASAAAKLTAYKLYRFGKRADSYYGVQVLSASAVEAVVNTAYAYLNKAQYIQYDQTTIVKTSLRYSNVPNWRRQVRVYPEEATGDVSNLYMDCSSFIWNVYCNVFGTDRMVSALGINEYDIDTAELINVSNNTLVEKYDLSVADPSSEEILSILQPGDIIVKRKTGHGHVAIWVGNGYIHCTGNSYSYNNSTYTGSDKTEESGAIRYASADTFSEAWWSGFETLVILRPLKVLGTDKLASYGIARSQLGGITVSKTAFVNGKELYDGLSVSNGDEVTYRITVSNPSNKGQMSVARTVNISDTDPDGMVHTFNSVTIEPDETTALEYTYTVSGSAGEMLSGGSGELSVAGSQGKSSIDDGRGVISFSAKSVAIENEVSDTTIAALKTKATAGTKSTSGILYVNELMSEITGNTVTLATSDSNLFSDIFESISGYTIKEVKGSMNVKDYLVSNYASGRMVINRTFNGNSDDFSTCARVRKIRTENLQIGDVVAVNSTGSSDYLYYIYLGEQSMLKINGTTTTIISDADSVLDGLLAKYSFAVLRVLGRV